MCLGCLSTDALLFVWDQYIITSDIPKFHDELIPAIAAAMIITLRDFLLKCKMVCWFYFERKKKNKTFYLNICFYIIDIRNGIGFTT